MPFQGGFLVPQSVLNKALTEDEFDPYDPYANTKSKTVPFQSTEFEPYDPYTASTSTTTEPKQKSFVGGLLDELWNNKTLNTPVVDLNPLAKQGADALKKQSPEFSKTLLDMAPFGIGSIIDQYYGDKGYDPREVTAGAVEQIGKLGTEFTTPYNLGLIAATEGGSVIKNLGLEGLKYAPGLAKLATWGARAGSAPLAAQGVRDIYNMATGDEPFSWGGAAGAGANALFGGIGMRTPMPEFAEARTPIPKVATPPKPAEAAPANYPTTIFNRETGQGFLPGMHDVNFGAETPPTQAYVPAPTQPAISEYSMFPEMMNTQADLPLNSYRDPNTNLFGSYNSLSPEMRQGVLGESPFTFPDRPTMADMEPVRTPEAPPAQPELPPQEPFNSRNFTRDQKRDALIQAGYRATDVFRLGDVDLDQVFSSLEPGSFDPTVPPPVTEPVTPSPFQAAPPTSTVEAPPTTPTVEAPPTQGSSEPSLVTSPLPGVIFKGPYAIITQPSSAVNAELRQRGYQAGHVVDGYAAMKLPDELAATAFSQEQTAPPTTPGTSTPARTPAGAAMEDGTIPVGPNDEVTLPKKFATKGRIQALANQGYKVIETLPNGDVLLGPSGTTMLTDPFGIGSTIDLLRKALRRGRGEPIPASETLPEAAPEVAPEVAPEAAPVVASAPAIDITNVTHIKDFEMLSNQLRDEGMALMRQGNWEAANANTALRSQLHARYNELNANGGIDRSSRTNPSNIPAPKTEPPLSTVGAPNIPVEQARIQAAASFREFDALSREYSNSRRDAVRMNDAAVADQYGDLYRATNRARMDFQNAQQAAISGTKPSVTSLDTVDEIRNRIQAASTSAEADTIANELYDYSGRTASRDEQRLYRELYREARDRSRELAEAEKQARMRPIQDFAGEALSEPALAYTADERAKAAKQVLRDAKKPVLRRTGALMKKLGIDPKTVTKDIDPQRFSRGLSHSYATRELTKVPDGAPGMEFITKFAPHREGGYGSYEINYRNSQGKAIAHVSFSSEGGTGQVGSYAYDRNAGLSGRALIKMEAKMAEYGVKMPSGSYSRHTLNHLNKISKMAQNMNSGFINLAELFSPDGGGDTMYDYLKSFFSKKNAKGQTVIDGPKLAEEFKKSVPTTETPVPSLQGPKKPSLGRELYNFARGMTTTMDLSAPLRQGLPMMFSKNYWKSLNQMRLALGDEKAFQQTLKDLQNRKMFQKRYDPKTGKFLKSYAEMAGMKLSDLKSLSSREEAVASNWAETGGMLGSDVPFLNKETGLQRKYQKSVGAGARATNRAYTAFLNQLRADSFESLVGDAYRDFKAGTKGSKNPYTDLTYAREIADYVNTATGRGPLKVALPGIAGGRLGEGGTIGMKNYSGEQFAKLFTDVIFSPRLMASRVRMLNPGTYMMASPFVRKQYLKSLISVAGFAGTTAALAKGMGANVSLDPNSADFMKIRMGNTRLDLAGGFQQYVVAASRLLSGHTTSSASGKDFELGQGYRAPTAGTVEQNFMTNKLHPIVKFANDIAFASTHQPFQVGDRTMQLFMPLIIGDVLDLVKEDPKLLPLLAPITFGAGSQTYDKGTQSSKYLPSKYDLNLTSGSQMFPWNWGGINKEQ